MLHINLHLERMADYCVTIAKLTKLVAGLEPDSRMIQAFEEMGSRAEEMIKVALEAFVDRDVDEAPRWSISTSSSTGRTGASSGRCSSSIRS
jgi:phosphate uptake regulator